MDRSTEEGGKKGYGIVRLISEGGINEKLRGRKKEQKSERE